MMYPDYQRVDSREANKRFEALWGAKLDLKPGLTVVEIMHAAKAGKIRGMYIMGENPAMSDPDVEHAREAMAGLEHLVVQDIFLTETAYLADVVLPATAFPEKDGTLHQHRPHGAARRARRSSRRAMRARTCGSSSSWRSASASTGTTNSRADVFAEMRKGMNSIAGITWERLERDSCVTYPCENEGDPGEPVVFTQPLPDRHRARRSSSRPT